MNTIDALAFRLRALVNELIEKQGTSNRQRILGSISASTNIPTSVLSHALTDDATPNLKMISKINDAIDGGLDFFREPDPLQAVEDVINSEETPVFYAHDAANESNVLYIRLKTPSDLAEEVKFLYVNTSNYNGEASVAMRNLSTEDAIAEVEEGCRDWEIEDGGDLAEHMETHFDENDHLYIGEE